jgi:hypothetical protein
MANESKTNLSGKGALPDQVDTREKCEKCTISPTTLKYHECDPDMLHRESIQMEVQTNMPAPGPAPLASVLLPGEHKDIRIDLQEMLANADVWLATPNSKFSGRRPLDLIGAPDEQLLRDMLRSALYSGMA